MVDFVVLVAFALLVLGVVGTVTPLVPGALLSLAGVLLYWWNTGYASPGPVLLAVLVLVCLLTLVVDYFAGAIGASAAGASRLTVVAAAVGGLVLLVLVGPLGILIGVPLIVFGIEFFRNEDAKASARTAVWTTVSILGSAVVQVLLLGSVLVAMAVVAVV